tara:strand:+ start:1962 stop:2471 length:510 start_codon:yes stop_codon:yes gene_type:complete
MGMFKDCGCGCNGKKQDMKFKISLLSALIFFIVANPETYKLVSNIFGKWVCNVDGCPSFMGLLLHTLVFMLVVWGIMNIRKEYMEGEKEPPTAALPPMDDMEDPLAPPMEDPLTPPMPSNDLIKPSSNMGMMPEMNDVPEDLSSFMPMEPSNTYQECSCSNGQRVLIMK